MYGVKAWPTQVLIDHEGLVLGSMAGDGKLAQLDLFIRNQIDKNQVDKNTRFNSLSPAPVIKQRAREAPAVLSFPGRIITANDRLYVSDSGHNRILMLSLHGDVLRQYGSEAAGFIDGNATNAAFHNPQGMTHAGDFLYVADERNHAIRRIHTVTGDVDTIAGNGMVGIPLLDRYDAPVDVSLNSPSDVVFKDSKLYYRDVRSAPDLVSFTGDEYLEAVFPVAVRKACWMVLRPQRPFAQPEWSGAAV